MDKIAKLSKLYKEGILTEEEFTSKKKELLKNAN
nr:MAG TPA: Short C-terminal domain [Caudoviricetes sp.]